METKLKFKVGDKVRVKSLEWYNNQPKDMYGDIHDGITFIKDMVRYCGKVLSITKLYENSYGVDVTSYVWQDWMLEDEAVTEEKQEVEQLNKIEMETKKMTLQEAQEFVKNTKYIVWDEDESRQLQKKLFEFGCGWLCGGPIVSHTEHPFLIVDKDLRMFFINKESYGRFEESQKIYHLKDDIFNIKIEKQPKFDPKTLRPYDKVLVREAGGRWIARFFDIYEGGYNVTSGHCWTFCIPFNEETKHLHGTAEDAPEFYRLD